MSVITRTRTQRRPEAGVTLYLVAAGIFVLLGACGLAIDLGWLYLGRTEAQRAADAAALAGAQVFVDSGCTSGVLGCSDATVQAAARRSAEATGNRNLVGGASPNIQDADITFDNTYPADPRITVTVHQTMPTFFMKIFGTTTANVSAKATAEATSVASSVSCAKPWILPNCDQNPAHSTPANPNCPGYGYFVDPATLTVLHPGPVSSGGVIGEAITLKSGDPQSAPVPSQYYPIELPVASTTSVICPECAGNITSGTNGANIYGENIACCNTSPIAVGTTETIDLNLKQGDMQGPTISNDQCLIHQGNGANGTGQDTLCDTIPLPDGTNATCSPLQVFAGANNPYGLASGSPISRSDSIVNVPIYDGHALCPGGSCTTTVTVIGFLQVFINHVSPAGPDKGTVYGTIMNISTGPPGGGGPAGGGSAIPIRLIQNP